MFGEQPRSGVRFSATNSPSPSPSPSPSTVTVNRHRSRSFIPTIPYHTTRFPPEEIHIISLTLVGLYFVLACPFLFLTCSDLRDQTCLNFHIHSHSHKCSAARVLPLIETPCHLLRCRRSRHHRLRRTRPTLPPPPRRRLSRAITKARLTTGFTTVEAKWTPRPP